jgi:hypothetical protein
LKTNSVINPYTAKQIVMKKHLLPVILLLSLFSTNSSLYGQETSQDSIWKNARKNIIRYNVSSALIFGINKSLILGYERVLSPRRSISVNAGSIALPKLISYETDSFSLNKNGTNKGMNFSLDYRFYLSNINKYPAPRGVYVGPWYSYNSFTRENDWEHKNSSTQRTAKTETRLNIHSLGAELGYQFVFWKRLTVDLVMIGPGFGIYNVKAKFDSGLSDGQEEQLKEALIKVLSHRFPGMDIVFENEELNASGKMKVTSFGYRYIMHIGFNF